jgi:hypothetical protein
VKSKRNINLVHLLVCLYIFDNARYRNQNTKERISKIHAKFHLDLSPNVKELGYTGVPLNPLNAKVYPICHLLALLGAHPILHISRIRVNNSELNVI